MESLNFRYINITEFTLQKPGDILQLWDVVWIVTTVVLQKWKHVVELFTGVSRIQFGQFIVDCSPYKTS